MILKGSYFLVACRLPTLLPLQVILISQCKLSDSTPYTDVVKTRLQVEARTGQTHYSGLKDTFSKICTYGNVASNW